jgi:hypothetical protein
MSGEEVGSMVEVSDRTDRSVESENTDRDWARAMVEKKHKLRADVVAYVVINLALLVAWALSGFGYFWPGWVLGFWGAFLLLDAWNVYYRRPVTEEEIEREMRRRV